MYDLFIVNEQPIFSLKNQNLFLEIVFLIFILWFLKNMSAF
jgi:hypothetical protein